MAQNRYMLKRLLERSPDPGSGQKKAQTPSEATAGFMQELLLELEWEQAAVEGLTSDEHEAIKGHIQIPQFQWEIRCEDDAGLLQDVRQHYQAH
ncbi:hypothetical protein WJX84_009849 [Apatococcus fuscideae]|uniref:Uncharacterized protein n=1 Tax=Apatococcus fuscideae TaxID=2026836 RepID=A0AAW1T6K4_9CHLO